MKHNSKKRSKSLNKLACANFLSNWGPSMRLYVPVCLSVSQLICMMSFCCHAAKKLRQRWWRWCSWQQSQRLCNVACGMKWNKMRMYHQLTFITNNLIIPLLWYFSKPCSIPIHQELSEDSKSDKFCATWGGAKFCRGYQCARIH